MSDALLIPLYDELAKIKPSTSHSFFIKLKNNIVYKLDANSGILTAILSPSTYGKPGLDIPFDNRTVNATIQGNTGTINLSNYSVIQIAGIRGISSDGRKILINTIESSGLKLKGDPINRTFYIAKSTYYTTGDACREEYNNIVITTCGANDVKTKYGDIVFPNGKIFPYTGSTALYPGVSANPEYIDPNSSVDEVTFYKTIKKVIIYDLYDNTYTEVLSETGDEAKWYTIV